jgi:hypothetical protein
MSSRIRRLELRRQDRCAGCHLELAAGELATWDTTRREVRCLGCDVTPAAMASTPGASARRKSEQLRADRETRVRKRLGRFAGVALALGSEPQDERNWTKGADGEVVVAAQLERHTVGAGVVLLHDRRIPGTSANIDHLAISPGGVFVIDAKRYSGRIAVKHRGGLLNARTEHLIVGGRDRSKLVGGVLRQVDIVERALASHPDVRVRGVLCFVDGNWPLLGSLEVRGVPVLPPRKTARRCSAPGPLGADKIEAVAQALAARFSPA